MKLIVSLLLLTALAACGGGEGSSATGDGGCTGNCAITTATAGAASQRDSISSSRRPSEATNGILSGHSDVQSGSAVECAC